MLKTATNRKRLAGVATLAAGITLFAVTTPSAAYLDFLFGTGTATAWDKQLAHDLAFRDAVAKALSTCVGGQDGGTELSATYDSLPSGQWHVTVKVRAACNFLDNDGRG
ncbi:MAG TPA: hypothetical protein VN905_06445 [Candidatus Binatia bacterium]|nr:hypothetical protein [Candidatus Binatia bacterium]